MNFLGVWRGEQAIGALTRSRAGVRFVYEPEVLEREGLGRPVVSMSLPTSARPYSDRQARPFFDGLLPEGEARRIIAYDFGVAEYDTFAMLRAIGRDCAGALSILPRDEQPPRSRATSTLPPMSRGAIDELIANLRFHPLGVGEAVRASLGGVQEKLLLTERPDGSWALPSADVASTHILKPSIAGLADSVINEAVCLRFASRLGVRAANVAVDRFGRREVLVVERFDRRRLPNGQVARDHQETACQALAVPVAANARKYEESGGPKLRAIADLLSRWSSAEQHEELLRQTTVNMLIGNADAHAMNVSFVLAEDGAVRLAPLYDVFCTVAYPELSVVPGMFIAGVRDIRSIGRDDLVTEAASWGIHADRAGVIVGELCERSGAALARTIAEFDDLPAMLSDMLRRRVDEFVRS